MMASFRQSTAASALLILAPLFWAGNFVVGRAMHADMPPVGLAFWRWAIALAALAPFAKLVLIVAMTIGR